MGLHRAVFTVSTLTGLAVFFGGALQCGGESISGDDGGTREGGRDEDATAEGPDVHSEAASEVGSDGPATGDVATPDDAGPDGIVWPRDGGKFVSCAMNECDASDICIDVPSMDGGDAAYAFAFCTPTPGSCNPDPTCFCIEEAIGCSNCTTDGGILSVTCAPPVSSPP